MKRMVWIVAPLVALLFATSCGEVEILKPEREGSPPRAPDNKRDLSSSTTLGFEEGKAGHLPRGWEVDSSSHLLELDSEMSRSGKFSGRLSHLDAGAGAPQDEAVEEPGQRGKSDAKAEYCAEAKPYRGGAVRFSGFLKVQGGFASMALRGESGGLSQQHVSTDDISSSAEWIESEVVAYLPQDATTVCILFTLRGAGIVWADDFSFEEVELSGPESAKISPIPLENLDMETWDQPNKLRDWSLRGKSRTELEADAKVKHSGALSARLQYLLPKGAQPGTAFLSDAELCTDPEPFVGRVVRLVGWIQTDIPRDSSAYMRLSADLDEEVLSIVWKRILDSSDWDRHEVVASVPTGVKQVCFAFGLFGAGRVWADDFSVENLEL